MSDLNEALRAIRRVQQAVPPEPELLRALAQRFLVLKGDGLVNRSDGPKPTNVAGNRDPHCTELHRNGGFERWLTIEELSAKTGWTQPEIYSLTRRRRANRGLLPLPHKHVGRKLYFEWSKVLEWLNRQPGVELPDEKGNQQK